jgi:hypothetical protein
VDVRLDPDLLGEEPFEVDTQIAHLFKHPHLGMDDEASPGLASLYRRDRR